MAVVLVAMAVGPTIVVVVARGMAAGELMSGGSMTCGWLRLGDGVVVLEVEPGVDGRLQPSSVSMVGLDISMLARFHCG